MLVNDQYVFRFPRGIFADDEPIKTSDIKKEINVLNFLYGKTSFGTPKPDFVAPGERYFGYKLLPGTLWDHLPAEHQFSDELLQNWIRVRCELAKKVPAGEADRLGVRRYHTDKNVKFVQQYLDDPNADERVKKMATEARDYVLEQIAKTENWVFVHEDLQMSNCILDEAGSQITAVIDFGDSEVAPIEADFYFWSKYGKKTLHKLADMQEKYDGTRIDPKLALCMHQFYIVADYVDFTARSFADAAAHKWKQIEAYL